MIRFILGFLAASAFYLIYEWIMYKLEFSKPTRKDEGE